MDRQQHAPPIGALPDESRADVVRRDLVKRLRRSCAHFSDEQFRRLMDDMVEQQLRSERRKTFA